MQAGLAIFAGCGTLSCDSWQVSQVSALCALFASFCPCSWQDVHSTAAASPAAYRLVPATPAIMPKKTEPSLRPMEMTARFFTRLGSHGRPAHKLPVHISGSQDQAE